MNRLITILRAAHCRSTHQFFVLDALPLVATDAGGRLSQQLLRHYQPYLRGAKAPDKEFRDFRNHVVHVRDNHWGGAGKAAQQWYEKLLGKMRQGNWSEAAYCAGVLSHYFTDPLMPLHTAQSEKESIVHRPLEWSVTKSYDRILQQQRQRFAHSSFELTSGEHWMADAVVAGATVSNQYYEPLIDRYDLQAGSRKPETGFDDPSVEILAELFGLALTGWAAILERAAEESDVEIPEASLSLASLVASISMPVAWIVRRIESASEQKAVRAIFEEFQSTGTVTKNLPPEVLSVKQERRRDRIDSEKQTVVPTTAPHPQATRVTPKSKPVAPLQTIPLVKSTSDRRKAPSLALSDDLVDAPSIGPKTAKRFAKIGITTVEQFLAASPALVATRLATNWIKTETIIDWQDQARLVSMVPGLCGYKSQLLVGVECRDAATLASSNAAKLHAQIQRYAGTRAGKRALRSSRVPSLEDVTEWIENAGAADWKQAG